MNRRTFTRAWGRRGAACAVFAAAGCIPWALAAPRITRVESSAPPHGQAGAMVAIWGHGFVAPLQVLFSDGTNPAVAAANVVADPSRGVVMVDVPAGAATGYLKLTASGVDSNLYYFRRDAGTFARGTSVVSGQVLGPALAPVAGAVVLLMTSTGCDGSNGFWDHATTDATGHYTLHGQPGGYMVFIFPPRATGLSSFALEVTAPGTADATLVAGTTVNGRVVLQSAPATGVANARVDLEGDGYETAITDASGYFSMFAAPGDTKLRVIPSPLDSLARPDKTHLTIGAASPQTVPPIALAGGVRIHGTVLRQADSTPMPGVEVSGWSNQPCCFDAGNTESDGDGTYSLVVAPNGTYSVNTSVESIEPYASAQADQVVVGVSDVVQNFSLADAGFIRGRIVDQATSQPLRDIDVQASPSPWGQGGGGSVASTRTCDDGTFSLHVPPSASGYIVTSPSVQDSTGYVSAAWKVTVGSTFFPCEGTPVTVSAVGNIVSGVDFALRSGAGAMEGWLRSQSSGCSSPYGQDVNVNVDDGTTHACGLGMRDWSLGAGQYRITGLPSSSIMPVMRACVTPPGKPTQCFDAQSFPGFTSVSVPADGTRSGVNFCINDLVQPVQQVGGLRLAKSGGNFTLSWDPSTDPSHSWYRLRIAATARPASSPGSFPGDPSFTDVWDGTATSTSQPVTVPAMFFLVTSVGSSSLEGPSGHYPLAP